MKKLIVAGAAFSAAAAFAQTPPAPAPTGARSGDVGEIVCRTLGDPSSRLKTRRVCMTRAEWRARNLEQRGLLSRLWDRRTAGIF
jgi:hypothetical protein